MTIDLRLAAIGLVAALTAYAKRRAGGGCRPGAHRRRQERGAGHLVHDAHRRSVRAPGGGSLREEIRHQGGLRPRRSDRDRPADRQRGQGRPGAGRYFRRFHRRNARQGRLCAELAPRCGPASAEGSLRSRRLLGRLQHLCPDAGLQHRAGAEGNRAEDVRGPARSQMEGQDGLELAQFSLERAGFRRLGAHRNGRGQGARLFAEARHAEHRQCRWVGPPGPRRGHRRRIFDRAAEFSTTTP